MSTSTVKPTHFSFKKFYLALSLLLLCTGSQAQQAPSPIPTENITEQGKFILHKFAQAIGTETYQVTATGEQFQLTSTFEFNDRGTAVPLKSSYTYTRSLEPLQFDIKGKNSRESTIDQAVRVDGDILHIRVDQAERDAVKPAQFFTMAGYAPTAQQMMLMRYWQAHGMPEQLTIYPSGTVHISARGSDQVRINGSSVTLQRYLISGVIWGREAIWLDAHQQLVALVSIDAEFDHFEAVREDYETALPVFLASAGKDEMASMAEIARQFSDKQSGRLALVGGTLIDGTGRPPVKNSVVLIENGRIVSAGPKNKIIIPKEVRIVDTTGKFILPGLWDMHAHFEQVEWGSIYLAAGITTVRDCGNEFEFITAIRDEIAAGRGIGPRLLLAGLVDGSGPMSLGVQRVDSADDATKWVARYHDAGFTQMKIYSSMTEANVAAVAKEAHRLGMRVTGHIPESMTLEQGVDAGMDQVNHIPYVFIAMMADGKNWRSMSEEKKMLLLKAFDVNGERESGVIRYLKQHSVVIDPTVALFEWFMMSTPSHPLASFEPGVDKLPGELAVAYVTASGPELPNQSRVNLQMQRYLEIIGALHKVGVPLVAGTDQAVPGHSLYREMELYVKAGMTPMEAIQSATLVPARAMGLARESGTVEKGRRADVIILSADPLQDIHHIRSVEQVISAGVLYQSAPLWSSVGFKP